MLKLFKKTQKYVFLSVLFILFIWLSVNANPGWIKYPDSHFYLNIAMSWAEGNPVINDGSGAFVRPVAYALQGAGYALGGFDGLYQFVLAFCFLILAYVSKSMNILLFSILLLFVTSPLFIQHSNNILLQLPAFSFVLLAVKSSFQSDNRLDFNGFVISVILLFGVFVHGGVIFLWLAYLSALAIKELVEKYNVSLNFVYFSTIKLGAIFSFLFIVLGLFEIYFESPVFYSFFRESGFSNNGDNYQVGSFFVEYLDSLSKSVGIPGWIVWSIFLVASVRLIKGCLVHKKVDFIILWLVLFLIGLELLTLIGVMNRSATAGEYYRVYFNTYPLFIYIGYQQLMWLVSIINIKLDFQYRSRFKFYSLIVMGLFLLGFVQHNFSESIHRIEKSPYDGVREYSKTTINSNAEVLIIPANVYRHRKFFAHDDFSDSNITYYGDHCFKDGAKPPHLNDFDHILIVKNQRLIDKRINSKLIENGCSPDSYLENLLKESRYSKIAEFNEIEVHVR